MLKDSLYKVIAVDRQIGVMHAALEVDPENEIFKGHFPNQPVLPGACMMQMVKEVYEDTTGTPIRLKKADNLKFLSLVDPQINKMLHLQINYAIDDTAIKITASLVTEGIICFKLQGIFVQE